VQGDEVLVSALKFWAISSATLKSLLFDKGLRKSKDVLNWWNYRMAQFQATILLVQLEGLDERLEIRQRNCKYLTKRL